MNTFDALSEIIARDYAASAGTLTAATTLESLAIDSLGVIELIFAIEDRFKVSVPDSDADMAKAFGTLGELSDYVNGLIAARDAAEAGSVRVTAPAAAAIGSATSASA